MKDTRLTLLEVSGPLNTLNERLAGENGKDWLCWLNKFNRKENPWEEVVKKLLKFLGIVVVPAMKRFVVKDYFIVDKNDIGWTGDNFEKWFLNMIEEPVEKTELRNNRLTERSVDNPIIAELGGRRKAKTFLSQISYLMKNVLQKDGTVYVFYTETTVFSKDEEHLTYENEKGEKMVLRAVSMLWDDDGWGVDALSVERPDRWPDGYQIFSRNSCLPAEASAQAGVSET